MAATKVAMTIDSRLLAELDRLVAQHVFANRSKAIQEALADTLARMRRQRLAHESAKLSPLRRLLAHLSPARWHLPQTFLGQNQPNPPPLRPTAQ
jgi:Arc/MetJ-type ribon-helix-helix transcriptional regulator